jgi:SAM-dependent methyltransferase
VDPTVAANRSHWNASSAEYQAAHDPHIGGAPKLWGVHSIPDSRLHAIGDVSGLDVLEYGCGAAQWASSLAVEGARIIGIDLSDAQLADAHNKHPALSLVQAAGQMLPFTTDSFDLVFCDHGALSWVDPYVAVPEAVRVLRPGGRLVFNVASPFVFMCWDDPTDQLGVELRGDYFPLHADVADDGSTNYTLGYGDWVRLFRANELVVEDLIEPRPVDDTPNSYWPSQPADWFTRWPGECLWVTRLADR